MDSDKRKCKRCLIRDMAEEDRKDLEKYIDAIKPQDRAPEDLEEKRLDICRTCDSLEDATCMACGCYVEFRAALRDGRCPRKKWK